MVRAAVASNYETPWSLLEKLTEDASKHVRRVAGASIEQKEAVVKDFVRSALS